MHMLTSHIDIPILSDNNSDIRKEKDFIMDVRAIPSTF